MDKIGVREVIEIGGHTFNEHTILMTWLTMAIVILVAVLATRNLKEVPTGWQNAIEAVADLWETQVKAMIGAAFPHAVPVPHGGQLAGPLPRHGIADQRSQYDAGYGHFYVVLRQPRRGTDEAGRRTFAPLH